VPCTKTLFLVIRKWLILEVEGQYPNAEMPKLLLIMLSHVYTLQKLKKMKFLLVANEIFSQSSLAITVEIPKYFNVVRRISIIKYYDYV